MVYIGGFFPKLEFSRGFLCISLIFSEGSSKLQWAGNIILFSLGGLVIFIIFLGYRIAMGGARRGAGNIIYQSLGGPVERYTLLAARVRA